MEEEISLKEFYQIVKKHFLTILIALISGIIATVLIMIFFITPKYSSQAQLLVNQQTESSQTQIQYNEVQTNISLINTYSDIITGYSILSQVNDNLGSDYSIKTLSDAISVGQSSNSQAFNLTVSLESPEEAQMVLTELINVFESTIKDVYDVASILVLSPASYNPNKVSPSLTLYILIGALIGLAVSFVIILIIELLDTTVKEEEYLIQLGLISLGHVYELNTKELNQSRLVNKQKQNNNRERI